MFLTEMEEEASHEVKTEKHIAPGEAKFLWELIQDYGDNYEVFMFITYNCVIILIMKSWEEIEALGKNCSLFLGNEARQKKLLSTYRQTTEKKMHEISQFQSGF